MQIWGLHVVDLFCTELARVVRMAQVTAAHVTCRPVDRTEWPRVCESRLARDVTALRALASSISNHDTR